MRISQVAERSGVAATTLRFYESEGLLASERLPNNYRVYDESVLETLSFISMAKRLSLSLEEIRAVLRVWSDDSCANVRRHLRPVLSARIADVDQAFADLELVRQKMQTALVRLDELPDRHERCDPSCAFLSIEPAPVEAAQAEEVPVACSLGSGMGERLAEWHEVLAGATPMVTVGQALVELPVSLLAQVAALAAAEQECCPFFDFTLRLNGTSVELGIKVPAHAHDMLLALLPDSDA